MWRNLNVEDHYDEDHNVEDLNGEDLDGEDLNGEDLNGEDLNVDDPNVEDLNKYDRNHKYDQPLFIVYLIIHIVHKVKESNIFSIKKRSPEFHTTTHVSPTCISIVSGL